MGSAFGVIRLTVERTFIVGLNDVQMGGASVVVALLPARTDTRWFHDFIYNKPGVEIRFVKGRIKFSGTTGAGKFPSMVVTRL